MNRWSETLSALRNGGRRDAFKRNGGDRPDARRNSQSGQASLLSLLAAIAIILILFVVFYLRKPNSRSEVQKEAGSAIVKTDNKSVLGAAMDQGKGVECANNLRQLRTALEMDADTGDGFPPSLQRLSGIPASMKACPATGKPYFYDPRTGQVRCLTPGHEKL
jgi:hypothetical protein